MKRILVTGGAGFIGSHLCERLVTHGNRVIALDNFFTGQHRNLSLDLWTGGVLNGQDYGLEVVRADVCDPMHFEVDEIYHLACPASPVHYQRNPVRTIKTCVQGTLHALELARETGARLLIASTSEVYGDPQEHPQREGYFGNVNPNGDRSCYDEGKRCAESLATSYARQFGTEVRIARIFNCYGPRMAVDDGRVVSNFIVQTLRGENKTIYGDGSQTRSFIYIDDLVEGLVKLMEWDGTRSVGDPPELREGWAPINLGNPGEFTIMELAREVATACGSVGVSTRTLPLPSDDPKVRKPDISRAKLLLGWEPVIRLREGLPPTVKYFRGLLQK